jgi:hypothetical protein
LFLTKLVMADKNFSWPLLKELIALAKSLFAKCCFFGGLWTISTTPSSKEGTLLGTSLKVRSKDCGQLLIFVSQPPSQEHSVEEEEPSHWTSLFSELP